MVEVLPVFGAYADAPWAGTLEPLPPSHAFTFNRMRNDSAIGADQIAQTGPDGWRLPYERYPFATCELGGGIQVTYHRRPRIRPMDVYALAAPTSWDALAPSTSPRSPAIPTTAPSSPTISKRPSPSTGRPGASTAC